MKTFRSQLNGWLFILSRYQMKQTKNAGLVSCGLEEYLINKINNDLSKKKHKKFESEVLKEKKIMDKLMIK